MPLRPPIRNMTDYVVWAFVVIVAVILLVTAIGSIVWVFISPTADISGVLKALADIVSAIISALIGFMAGRGTGREETHREYREKDEQDDKDKDE